MAITCFSGEYRFLSNFYPCEINFEGMTFPSVEHAYVAAKTLDMKQREFVQTIKTPGQAKRYGRKKITLRSDWEKVKVRIMYDLVFQKFSTHMDLRQKLLNTKNETLVEGNNHGDNFWGTTDGGMGLNVLGKILMHVRTSMFAQKYVESG